MKGNTVRLIVQLQPRSKLGGIEVRGAGEISEEKILAAANLAVGELIDEAAVKEGCANIEEIYRKQGFAETTVSFNITAPNKDGDSKVVYSIWETALVLRKIEFVGNEAFSSRVLAGQMELSALNGKMRLLRGDMVEADMHRIEEHYRNHGYLNARMEQTERKRFDDEKADLVITVFEGEQYTVNTVEVNVLALLPLDEITPKLRLKAGEVYSGADLKHDLKLIEDELTARGHVGVRVVPNLTAAGPRQVSVSYDVKEGEKQSKPNKAADQP
jgi:outer membrane protein insertion porin family